MPLSAFVAAIAIVFSAPAAAQLQRNFPQNALRGEIQFGAPPEIVLNGRAVRLAPGARVRNQNNLLETTGALAGQRAAVHYTLDLSGLVKDVWLLRPDELAKRPWPRTPQEARSWSFDAVAQVWTPR